MNENFESEVVGNKVGGGGKTEFGHERSTNERGRRACRSFGRLGCCTARSLVAVLLRPNLSE